MPIYIPQTSDLLGIYRQGKSDRMAMEDRQIEIEEKRAAREAKAQRDRILRRALGVDGEQPQSSMPGATQSQAAPAMDEQPTPGVIPTTEAPRYEGPDAYTPPEAPITATTQPKRGLDQGALRELMAVDLETATKLQDAFSKMDKQALDTQAAKNAALGQVSAYLANVPMQRRGAELRRLAPSLLAAGWTPDELNNANLTNEGLQSYQALAMDVDKIIDNARQEREFSATEQHRRVTEGQGERRLGISESALGLARQREGRIAAGGGDDDGADTSFLLGVAGLD